MSPILFYLFAAMTLVFAVAVVANRNPVASALSLVVSFLGLAALFVGLDAYFIAVIQVLVYAGAVMVLFLFIIMLLDLKAETRRRLNIAALAGGIAVLGGFVVLITHVVKSLPASADHFPTLARTGYSDAYDIGMTLFSDFNLPFQIIGVLLLVSTIGVVFLSRRSLR